MEKKCSSVIVMSPLLQSADRNIIRVQRLDQNHLPEKYVLLVAGGQHAGIVVTRPIPYEPDDNYDMNVQFSVWLRDGEKRKQENRQLRFHFIERISQEEQHHTAQLFFKALLAAFPRDYVNFIKSVLKLMQHGFESVRRIEIDMQFASDDQTMQMPDPKEYDSGSEIESITVGHVQEVLEHAYPNGLTVDVIAEALRCTIEEVLEYLYELERLKTIRRVDDEWIRAEYADEQTRVVHQMPKTSNADQPTVAIITCMFIEKQSVDAMIDQRQTLHRYKSGGESNVYTLGNIGQHRVVATKLPVIGYSREAMTSAGSITTRLLGNFQRIEHVLIVGVGGAVAHYTDASKHVRLGDVVVSTSTDTHPDAYVYCHNFQIDRITEQVCAFVCRQYTPKDPIISNLVASNFAYRDDSNEWQQYGAEVLDALNSAVSSSEYDFTRPPPEHDVLAVSVGDGNMVVVPHPNKDRNQPRIHIGPIGAGGTIEKQQTLVDDQQPSETKETRLTKEPQLRDRFAAEYGLRAFDAGFDSVVAAIVGSRIDSWALIRGVSDYTHGQSRCSRVWQAYAALQAAALTKALVLQLPAPTE